MIVGGRATANGAGTADDQVLSCTGCSVFREDFDNVIAPILPNGWSATNDAGPAPLWATSASTADSPPNDAFVDDPATISDKHLTTPSIAITSNGARLSFRNNYVLSSGFDGGVLEISSPNINGGVFTDITDPAVGGSFAAGGYDAVISSGSGNPLADRPAWSGNQEVISTRLLT